MNRVEIINPFAGLAAMIVCAESDATDKEILSVCNRDNYAGTKNGWIRVLREGDEYERPVPCNEFPNRLHFVVLC